VALNRIYDRPEDDPQRTEKVIAGALFVAGAIGIVLFVIAMERRIRRFDPPQKRNKGRENGEDR
jgi:hypothetical protein